VDMADRKKSGLPVKVEFDVYISLQKFSPFCDSIDTQTDFKINEQYLSDLSFSLQSLMERYFGRNSPLESRRQFTKLPSRLFKDYSVPGPHLCILKESIDELKNVNKTSIDDSYFENIETCVTLFKKIESKLLQNGYFRKPTIFFTDSVSSIAEELGDIVTCHGGIIVQARESATHIIEWDEEVDGSLPEELSEEFIRTIEMRFEKEGDSTALVHWWYHPDSYDEWIPAQEVEFSEPPDSLPEYYYGKQWRVCSRFIRDLELFNEWCNEIDYEMDEEKEKEEEESVKGGGGGGGASSAASAGRGRKGRGRGRRRLEESRKRQRESAAQSLAVQQSDAPVAESITATEKMLSTIPPPSYDGERKTIKVLSVGPVEGESPSQCTVKEEKPVPVERPSVVLLSSTGGATGWVDSVSEKIEKEKDEQEEKKQKTSSSTRPVWFHYEAVSLVEMKFLPDFFDKRSRVFTPQKYLQIRNFIINLNDQQPTVYLSGTDCRKKLSGDVCSVLAVHEFLDAFGVINSEVKSENRPSPMPMLPDTMESDTEDGEESPVSTTWTSEEDKQLISVLSNVMKDLDDEADIDWNAVATQLTDKNKSASECLMRFVSLPLTPEGGGGGGGGSMQDGTSPITSTPADTLATSECTESLAERGGTRALREVAVSTSQRAWQCLGIQRAELVMKAAVSALVESGLPVDTSPNIKTIAAALGLSTAAYSVSVIQELASIRERQEVLLQEYATVRLQTIDEKIQMLSSVQKDLEQEHLRQDLDKRDIQIQRALLAYNQRERELRLKL